MPINSKYTNQQVEQLVTELLAVLDKNKANVELGLMCLGNATSHIISHSIAPAQQQNVVESFNLALKSAIDSNESKPH